MMTEREREELIERADRAEGLTPAGCMLLLMMLLLVTAFVLCLVWCKRGNAMSVTVWYQLRQLVRRDEETVSTPAVEHVLPPLSSSARGVATFHRFVLPSGEQFVAELIGVELGPRTQELGENLSHRESAVRIGRHVAFGSHASPGEVRSRSQSACTSSDSESRADRGPS